MAAIIDYLCANPEHHLAEDAATHVITHDGGWGYCPAGARAGHDWRVTGSRTLATVREWMGRPVSIQPDRVGDPSKTLRPNATGAQA